MNRLHELKLHESIRFETEFCTYGILRVPGGWIYTSTYKNNSVFVPFDKEFFISCDIKPKWDTAPEWAKWLAQDKTGEWCFYSKKPMKLIGVGIWQSEGVIYRVPSSNLVNNIDWENTLESRPVEV